MNILPKKRWHVRTKDNIARVRRDELAAAQEELKRQEKLEFAESEARINFLRQKSGLPLRTTSIESKKAGEPKIESFNLFSDYKSHTKSTNKDLEKEKKEEQEKYEKQIGYLTYLGQDTNEALKLRSWYEVAPKRASVGDLHVVEKDLNNKLSQDPLTLINALLPAETHTKDIKKLKRSPSLAKVLPNVDNVIFRADKSKKIKKDKKHKKDKKQKKEDILDSVNEKHFQTVDQEEQNKREKLERLRSERLRREASERIREEALLAPKEAKLPVKDIHAKKKIVQKYNSQFNPELAKQNMI